MIEQCRPTERRSVTARVAAIIHVIATAPDPSLTDVARCAGLPLSTTHRLVADLVAARLLRRTSTGRYRVGVDGLASAGEVVDAPEPAVDDRTRQVGAVRAHIADTLAELTSVTGLSSRFGVWHDDGVSVLDHPVGRGASTCTAGLHLLPVHATAAGRALLAHAGADAVARVLARPLPAYTDATVTTREGVLAGLAAVRATGVAVVRGEWRVDEVAIAVPVLWPDGVVAALELSGRSSPLRPATRVGPLPLGVAAPALMVGARALARQLVRYPALLPTRGASAWLVDPTTPALLDVATTA